MGGNLFDLAEISFFELDRLFAQSSKTLKRRQQRRRRKERKDAGLGDGESSSERSRTPLRRGQLRIGGRPLPSTGGFTGKIQKIDRVAVATGVPTDVDGKTIFRHYSKCGAIHDLQLVRGPKGDRTGVAIIEFIQEDACNRACALTPPFNEILGTPVTTKRADAQIPKKDTKQPPRQLTRQQFTQQVLSGLKMGPSDTAPQMRKLYIKNLLPVVREDDMRGIFKPFGEFEDFKMGMQECWITFQNHNDAQDAMSSMQAFQLVGQELQISIHSVLPKIETPAAPKSESMDFKTDSDFGATGAAVTPLHNRIELMKKLMASHAQQGIATVLGLGSSSANSSESSLPPATKPGSPTSCTLLLQHMFTPSTVDLTQEPRFYDELREDTHSECAKFGKVVHVTVDPRVAAGYIYVLFETPQQRMAGELALNGRWFEGKKIIAYGIDDSIWQDLAVQSQADGTK